MRVSLSRGAQVALVALVACDDGSGIGGVVGAAAFVPGAIEVGTVHVGETGEGVSTLRAEGLVGEVIREVRFESSDFLARTGDGRTLRGTQVPPGGALDVRVVFGPSVEGDAATVLFVAVGETEARLEIAAVARARAPALPAVVPGSIAFGAVEVGRTVRQPFVLKNLGELPARLVEVRPKSASDATPFAVTGPGGGAAVPSRSLGGLGEDTLELEAQFAPTRLGDLSAELELVFEGGSSAMLSVLGNGVPAGRLACAPSGLQFGPVTRGESATQAVHCTVSGGVFTLEGVTLAATSSSLFSLRGVPESLAAGEALDFEVVFDARGLAGEHSGWVQIVSASGQVTQIMLVGTVTPPPEGRTDIHLKLEWSTEHTDLDLHLVRGSGVPFDGANDCYYANKSPDWGTPNDPADDPFLDQDETDGLGPEFINLATADEDVFDVLVHFYNFSGGRLPATNVTVTVTLRGVEVGRVRQVLDKCGLAWRVGQLRFDRSPPTFTVVNQVTAAYEGHANMECQE